MDAATLKLSLQFFELFSVGLVGMFGHYIKQFLNGDIKGSLWDYLINQHPRDTGKAVFGLVTACGTIVLTTNVDGIDFKQLIVMALGTGYAADSLLNRGTPQLSVEAIANASPTEVGNAVVQGIAEKVTTDSPKK